MDKNKFWLGGRLFNTASRHVRKLGGPTHVRNATQGTSATQTQGKARPQTQTQTQGTSATQTQGTSTTQRKARPQDGRPNAKLIRNENVHTREHWAKRRAGGWIRTNFGLEVDFLIRPHQGWAPQSNEGHIRKTCAQRNARHVCKMGAQTKNRSATKMST